jgi:hypothetical protein
LGAFFTFYGPLIIHYRPESHLDGQFFAENEEDIFAGEVSSHDFRAGGQPPTLYRFDIDIAL